MQAFTYDAVPGRVVFGAGAVAGLTAEIGRLGCKRVLFIASPRWRDFVAERLAELGDAGAGHFADVVSQAPGELADELAELPQAVKFNAAAAPDAIARAAAALGTDDEAGAIFDLAKGMGSPTALADLGFAEADLDRAAALTVEMTPYNPRPLDIAGVRALFDDAFHGRRP